MKNNLSSYKQAPLPFVGQKRQFLAQYAAILNQYIPNDGQGWTIIDAFGGSGLLSHTAKQLKPAARVIYNDFDGYATRLKHIDDINQLRGKIYTLLDGVPRQKRITDHSIKIKIIETIEAFDGYKDLNCLASWLLFSGQQVATLSDLYHKDFWNCIRLSDYQNADGYLDGIEITNESFHTLLPRFINDQRTVFVLDPPYLYTKQESYKQAHYFDLIDFLRLINITRPPYIFFSSTKSEFVRFIEYMQTDKVDNWQAFDGAQRIAIKTSLNYQGEYEDNLVYKF
ncbi:hypothetical protein A6B39_10780 [Mannheimia granulomatis]|uniref:hypothetical protein n=1 Tax=Mannheimia granulomatis TaxID=85402 RepID=UPI00159E8D68|nr:hypothetical protein [Mannheimia granulomatis]QLB15898.1 hypothetical protein A6B39_10780 [Mannheimia granulomatis]